MHFKDKDHIGAIPAILIHTLSFLCKASVPFTARFCILRVVRVFRSSKHDFNVKNHTDNKEQQSRLFTFFVSNLRNNRGRHSPRRPCKQQKDPEQSIAIRKISVAQQVKAIVGIVTHLIIKRSFIALVNSCGVATRQPRQ
jgi:hypothetical protein